MTCTHPKAFMGDIDENQFQPSTTQPTTNIQHFRETTYLEMKLFKMSRLKQNTLCQHTQMWLVTAADRVKSKGTGFMLRLKWMWDEKFEKNYISKQNLRDNAARSKIRDRDELEMNVCSEEAQIEIEQDATLNNNNKWTTETKEKLLKIEER